MKATSKRKQPKVKCSFRVESDSGFKTILGVDEVGRGCLAGPVVAAGVVFSPNFWDSKDPALALITDSKKLSAPVREELAEYIKEQALAYDIQEVSEKVIDEINILQATFKAARNVFLGIQEKLDKKIELVLIDGSQKIPLSYVLQQAVVGGDSVSKSIAAASIIAKVYRDKLMEKMAKKYPVYAFEKHKAYATKEHRKALIEHGPCVIHRKSFLGNIEKQRLGKAGEERVADYLKTNGFKILHTNWTHKGGEIDIVAEKSKKLHFVEVRARSGLKGVEFSFPQAKQKQFQKCVNLYLMSEPKKAGLEQHLHFFEVDGAKLKPFWDVFAL
jgi:ribonuclease HII